MEQQKPSNATQAQGQKVIPPKEAPKQGAAQQPKPEDPQSGGAKTKQQDLRDGKATPANG